MFCSDKALDVLFAGGLDLARADVECSLHGVVYGMRCRTVWRVCYESVIPKSKLNYITRSFPHHLR